MVQVKDDGVFDAPVDRIWKYLNDPNPGIHSHRAIVSARTLEQKGTSMTQEWEMRNPDGKTTRKETWRMTFSPPTGMQMESLAGVSKGTKYSNNYTPMGNRTKVEVAGEFRMQGLDDIATKQMALQFLAQVFEEDQANLRNYK